MSTTVTGQDRVISDNLSFTGSYTWDTSGGLMVRIESRCEPSTRPATGPTDMISDDHPTISMATPATITARPGETVKLTYH
jgi:hypothetical protein